jgi:hypothetical protein
MQDRPTATELLTAVQAFLLDEVAPMLGDARLRFRTLIAANVVGIVEREVTGEEERLRTEWQRLAALDPAAGSSTLPASLDALRTDIARRRHALCVRIRSGEADAGPWRAAVLGYARWAVEEKLRVSNPRYLARFTSSDDNR